MRESLIHARGIEIPHRRASHHVQPQRSENGEVHSRVGLFHEAILFCAGADAIVKREGADEALHEKLSGKRQDDNVEGDKGEVARTFAIVLWSIGSVARVVRDEWVVGRERVGEEDGAVEGI